jgi:hypothetical protein
MIDFCFSGVLFSDFPARSAAIFFMAKQYHDIFPQITEFSNIWLSWRKST